MAADVTAVSLVSKCSSVDEFVAAFRAYVHRDHVFVPTTGQVTAGRKGRIAITLADGTAVLSGDAEVLSASAVPQGPYQKPGIRVRFVTVDEGSREVMEQLARGRGEPPTAGDPESSPSGARADIRAVEGAADPTEAAMCTVVEAAAPAAIPAAVSRPEPTPRPKIQMPATLPRMVTPPTGIAGGVPGKSFKIPSIPSIPSIPPVGKAASLAALAAAPPAAIPAAPSTATAVPREASEAVSGDLTVPTDPTFREPSLPWPASTVVVHQPGGKARNRANTPAVRAKAAGSSGPVAAPAAIKPSVEPPAPVVEPVVEPAVQPVAEAITAPEADAIPEPRVESSPVVERRNDSIAPPSTAGKFKQTLIGLPASAIIPIATRQPLAPSGVDDWTAPEDGEVGDATEQTVLPVAEDHSVDVSMDEPAAPPAPPVPPRPVVASLAALGKSGVALRSGPSAPTMRTPQSMLELAATMDAAAGRPLPGMAPKHVAPGMVLPSTPPGMYPGSEPAMPPPMPGPAIPPPAVAVPAPEAVPTPVARIHDETELVRRDPAGTDQVFLPIRNLRPFVIGIVALGVVALGIVLGISIANRGGSKGSSSTGSAKTKPAPEPKESGTPVAVPALPDAAPLPVAAPIDAGTAAVAVTRVDAAVEAADPDPDPTPPPTPTVKPPAPAKGQCAVAFASTPPGASIVVAGKKHGKTPATVTLPCARATVVFQRPRYANESKAFSPKEGATTKVSARLERPVFTLRVVSSPAGATATVLGKSAGKTPASAKVPGFEAITVKVSKPGYQSKTTKVTAKKNGTVVNVTLRRGN